MKARWATHAAEEDLGRALTAVEARNRHIGSGGWPTPLLDESGPEYGAPRAREEGAHADRHPRQRREAIRETTTRSATPAPSQSFGEGGMPRERPPAAPRTKLLPSEHLLRTPLQLRRGKGMSRGERALALAPALAHMGDILLLPVDPCNGIAGRSCFLC